MQPHKMQDSSLNELCQERAVFVACPTKRASMAQGLFYGGSGCRAVAHTHPAVSKNALGPVGIPLLGGAPGDKPNPPEGDKSFWGDGPLRPKDKKSHVPLFILRHTSVRMWHKAVFKVGPVAGPKPSATGSSKNVSDPVSISLFGAPQAPGDKPNPSEEG